MTATDPLERFVTAQRATHAAALAELTAGAKRGHWMWFVFPQLAGLGRSATAAYYALPDVDAARAYLAHRLLGPRLAEAVAALQAAPGDDPVAILGAVDALKLRSSLTLFEAAGGGPAFTAALTRFYAGVRDPATLALLGR